MSAAMALPAPPRLGLPDLGFGVGLRPPHYRYVLSHCPAVDWFEVITENFLDTHGWALHVLECVAERYPVCFHGVSLSIGGTDALDFDYLRRVKRLARRIGPAWISDHLCWTGALGRTTHDLLPMTYREDSLRHVVARIRMVQDYLERPLVLENPSSYLSFATDTMSEADFVSEVADEAGCGLLVDVNNVYVSSVNNGFDPQAYLQRLPAARVVQIHLAGHADYGTHIVDTHDDAVCDAVLHLFAEFWRRCDGVATMVEWDARIPAFPLLLAEVARARERVSGLERHVPACADPECAAVGW